MQMERVLTNKKYQEALNRKELVGLKCTSCGTILAVPKTFCVQCGSNKLEEYQLGMDGEIISYTVINVPPVGYRELAPYAVAIIKLKENATLTGRLIDCDNSSLSVGVKVEAVFHEEEKGKTRLLFRPKKNY